MVTSNEFLQNRFIAHHIGLQFYSNGVLRDMIRTLNAADRDIRMQIADALERLDRNSFTVQRLEAMLASVRSLNAQAIITMNEKLPRHLQEMGQQEIKWMRDNLALAIPPSLGVGTALATVTPDQLAGIIASKPFQGVLLKEALDGIGASRVKSIEQAMRIGMVSSQTNNQIIQRIFGTRKNGYQDALLEKPRHQVAAIVQSAVAHTANEIQDEFLRKNADLIKSIQWLSTLDSRTTPMCQARDGKLYTVSTEPKPIDHALPWEAGPGRLHWNCRSTSVPVLKSWRELGIDVDEIEDGTRASVNGQVPERMTYSDWLRGQPEDVQNAILGKGRADIFRRTGLPIEKFVNDKGRYFSLEELDKLDGLIPVPDFGPRVPVWDLSTEAGKWQAASFPDAPTWLRDVVEDQQFVNVGKDGGRVSWAQAGSLINLGESLNDMTTGKSQNVWRHEFGHILDYRLNNISYHSSMPEFRKAMASDAKNLIDIAQDFQRYEMSISPKGVLTPNLNFGSYGQKYSEMQPWHSELMDAPREQRTFILSRLSKDAGLDYEEFKSALFDAAPVISNDVGIGSSLRIARVIDAYKRGDAEDFVRMAMGIEEAGSFAAGNAQFIYHKGSGEISSLSDLVGSSTKNRLANPVNNFVGHRTEYYEKDVTNAPTEAFANLTSLAGSRRSVWWQITKHFYPELTDHFEKFMKSEQEKVIAKRELKKP